jgi:hypothetical protein
MAAIRLITRIENDTLRIPELSSWIGKEVEIVINEKVPEGIDPAWETFFKYAGKVDIDEEAFWKMREISKI